MRLTFELGPMKGQAAESQSYAAYWPTINPERGRKSQFVSAAKCGSGTVEMVV